MLCQLKNGPSHPIEFTDSKETNCQCIYTSVKLCARYKGKRTHSSQIRKGFTEEATLQLKLERVGVFQNK